VRLKKARTKVKIKLSGANEAVLSFVSSNFQHRFGFEIPGIAHRSSDNFFALYPGETKNVILRFDRKVSAALLKSRLKFRSLADTY
jgi:beta-mannosidase